MTVITNAKLEDIGRVSIIDEECFGTEKYPLFVLRQYLDICQPLFYVANVGEELGGYCIGHLDNFSKQGWILSLGVLQKCRGLKIGEELTIKAIQTFIENDASSILLTVHPENIPALKIYQKLLFEIVDDIDNYYFDNSPRIIMRRSCK